MTQGELGLKAEDKKRRHGDGKVTEPGEVTKGRHGRLKGTGSGPRERLGDVTRDMARLNREPPGNGEATSGATENQRGTL